MTTPGTMRTDVSPHETPPLRDGERLSRKEFERRYDAMPELKKAELIEGVVHMPSPVRYDRHATPHADLIGWMVFYRVHTPGVRAVDNGSVRLDLENEPQPDASLVIEPAFGGHVRISSDDYIEGGPELVGEISATNKPMGTKFRVYQIHQVQEYIIWRISDQEIDWFCLEGEQYKLLAKQDGLYRSRVFPGLWLDPAAMARGDIVRVFDVLMQGVKTQEHAEFVARLESEKARRST